MTRIEAIEEDTEKEEKDEMDEANCVRKKEYTVADQLMMCWGVGPSKVLTQCYIMLYYAILYYTDYDMLRCVTL